MADTVVKNANKEDYLQKGPFIFDPKEETDPDDFIKPPRPEPFIEPEGDIDPNDLLQKGPFIFDPEEEDFDFMQKLSDAGADVTLEEELQMGEDLENRLRQEQESDILDRILQTETEPNVVDLREYQYKDLAPPLYGEGVEIKDITYQAPVELPMKSEPTYDIGIAAGGNVGIETLKKTTIELQETPPDRSTTVLQRMMKRSGAPARDPRLLAQLAQVLGRDV